VIDREKGSVRLPMWKYQAPLGETLPVRGNGMTLGITDGNKFGGFYESYDDSGSWAIHTRLALYSMPIGTKPSGDEINSYKSIGITADPDKSGIVAENNPPVDPFIWCIQVYNTATELSKLEST
jgi:hypothetical protein